MPTALSALSPLDGRYASKTEPLQEFFSEKALIKYRVLVEVSWLITLSEREEIPEFRKLTEQEQKFVKELWVHFDESDAEVVKEIEKTTNHDVKSVEYFIKEKLEKTSLTDISEWTHFALTSEDVNNIAHALMLKDSMEKCLLPKLESILETLKALSHAWKDVPLLARTHGQPASPTTMGKVMLNFYSRLKRQLTQVARQEFLGKFNGATGNYNAHCIAYPDADWLEISKSFVEALGLTWQPVSPQIEPHDFIAEISHTYVRIGTILIDFARDIWGYISFGYFKQKLKEGEVGSSTMPHKVNPIDFENAEGNFGMANSVFKFFADKLPITRWQRDLTDSTVLRNFGIAFGYFYLALTSIEKGIGKLEINRDRIQEDLEKNNEVLAEAVQTVMRKYGVKNPYEKLKALTRGKKLSMVDYKKFVETLKIPEDAKNRLLDLTPDTYIGLAEKIVEEFGK